MSAQTSASRSATRFFAILSLPSTLPSTAPCVPPSSRAAGAGRARSPVPRIPVGGAVHPRDGRGAVTQGGQRGVASLASGSTARVRPAGPVPTGHGSARTHAQLSAVATQCPAGGESSAGGERRPRGWGFAVFSQAGRGVVTALRVRGGGGGVLGRAEGCFGASAGGGCLTARAASGACVIQAQFPGV
jgi:hypothetical protein